MTENPSSRIETVIVGEKQTPCYISRFNIDDPDLEVFVLKSDDDLFDGQSVPEIVADQDWLDEGSGSIAINGDFFEQDFSPTGMLAIDGELWKGPASIPGSDSRDSNQLPRSVFAFSNDREVFIGRPEYSISLKDSSGNNLTIDRVNFPEIPTESVLYTHRIGDRTPPLLKGQAQVILTVQGQDLQEISAAGVISYKASYPGPGPTGELEPGVVILHTPKPVPDWIGESDLTIETSLRGMKGEPSFILGGLPVLVLDGVADPAAFARSEVFPEIVVTGNYPRTAIGFNPESREMVILVTDGYGKENPGLTLPELADWFVDQGCSYALNMDGGSSSTIVENGVLINNAGIEDSSGDGPPVWNIRPVGSALVFHYR